MLEFPLKCSSELVENCAGDDRIVFDARLHRIHTLNRVCWSVWDCCDGIHTREDISLATRLPLRTVDWTLTLLGTAGLLENPGISRSWTSSRRRISKRLLLAVPILTSTTVHTAAAHLSGRPLESGEQCVLADDHCRQFPCEMSPGGYPTCGGWNP